MKKYKRILSPLLGWIIFTSCEEVIDLELDNAEPRTVIEGYISDQPGPYTIEITQSTTFYDTNTFPPKTNATVIISDELGNEDTLTEVDPGIYQTNTLQGERGMTYTLRVEMEGNTYIATSKIPEQQILLDSIAVTFEEESLFMEEGYYATAYFNDTPDIEEYFRIYIYVNGGTYVFDTDEGSEKDANFRLANDKFSDGRIQDYGFPHRLESGDSVRVELHKLDRSTYDYFRTFLDVRRGGGMAPSNPISNFGDEVLGYFGAGSITKLSTVVE